MINGYFSSGAGHEDPELLQRMLSIVRRYDITVQKLNRLRFEAQREDRKGTGVVTAHFFKQMQKRFGFNLTSVDQRDMVAYFTQGLETHGGHLVLFSTVMIDKLVETLAKQLYKTQRQEPSAGISPAVQSYLEDTPAG